MDEKRKIILDKLMVSISVLEKIYWKHTENVINRTKSIEINNDTCIKINF